MSQGFALSEGGNLAAALAVFVGLIWLFNRTFRARRKAGRDMPPDRDEPYSIFTTEFDVVCSGQDLMPTLGTRGATGSPSRGVMWGTLEERTAIAEAARANCLVDPALGDAWVSGPPRQETVAILIDQSGSMANRMPRVAGELRAIVES